MWKWILFLFAFPVAAQQPWAGIVASSRAINWNQNAGLPTTFPDGETTVNAWTPPTRTTIFQNITSQLGTPGSPINSTTNALQTALNTCPAGQVVLLSANAYMGVNITPKNNCTLRIAAGFTIFLSGNSRITGGANSGAVTAWTSNFAAGSTSIGVASVSGFTVGDLALLRQCNDGTTGVNACTGTQADTGWIWNCAGANICSETGQGGQNPGQTQVVLVTGVNSGCSPSPCIAFSPGLYMPNWSATNTPWAQDINHQTVGFGIEGGTVDGTASTSGHGNINIVCYACWVEGVRNINVNGGANITTSNAKNILIANNYLTGQPPNSPENINSLTDCDVLVINNIGETGPSTESQASVCGDVYLYNFSHFGWSNSGNQANTGNVMTFHETGNNFTLVEGNEAANAQWDNDHSTHNLETAFRNLFSANDPPYTKSASIVALEADGASRFFNFIGNILGSPTVNSYQCIAPSQNCGGSVYIIGGTPSASNPTDTLALSSSFRWGNFDTQTAAVRFCGPGAPGFSIAPCNSVSEVPTSLPGLASSLTNAVPASTTLPASFYFNITAHPSGGTGLSWWKVCTNYPTCTTFQTQPFPTFGPDVNGGGALIGNTVDYYQGHAYDIPAALAWKNLPIDSAYQNSYAILSSSWSGGVETLTFGSGVLPTSPVGEFQLTGAPGGCTTGYTNGQIMMGVPVGAAATHVSYALASDPGANACATGVTFKWPDIRQFNASLIYQTDTASAPQATFTPSSLAFNNVPVGLTSNPLSVTLQNTGTASLVNTSIQMNNGKFSIQNNTCGSPATINLANPGTGFTLAVNATCTFQVIYTPPAVNNDVGGAIFFENTAGGNDQIAFSGIGNGPAGPTTIPFARNGKASVVNTK